LVGVNFSHATAVGHWYETANLTVTSDLTVGGTVTAGALNCTTANFASTGTMTAARLSLTYGVTAASAAFVGPGVSISSSATSSVRCTDLGAVTSLPTTGYGECTKAYQVSDHTPYISTEAVKAATSFKAYW
jgi:hypothetical protein